MSRPPLSRPAHARASALVRLIARRGARFGADHGGATAIEFAFLLVPFLALLLSLLQVGIFYYASEGLESAVEDAARNLYTGAAQTAGITTAEAFRTTYICPAGGSTKLPGIVDCSKLIIDVRSFLPSSGIGNANMSADFYKSTPQFCPGAPGYITVVRIVYPLPAIIPVLMGSPGSPGVLHAGMVNDVPGNSGWKQLALGTAVYQTEPYDRSKYTTPSGCS